MLVESHVAGEKADMIIGRLGLNSSHRVEAYGFAEGIWLLWNDPIRVDILVDNVQFVLTQIHCNDNELGILFTVVYGSPQAQKCHYLWIHLQSLIALIN